MTTSTSPVTSLGAYIAGEIPEPWEHQFTDADGVAITITGWTVRVTYRVDGGTQVVRNGTVNNGAAGKAGYTWVAADIANAGYMTGELTVGNGTSRYARSFSMLIRAPKGGTLPSI